MSLAYVGSTHSVPVTLGLPPLMASALSLSTLLRLQAALQGVCTSQAYAAQIQVFGYSTKTQTQLGLRFVPSPVGAAQAARSMRSALSPVQCALSSPRSQSQFPGVLVRCALCLFWEADFWLQPSWRMSTILNLRKSLVRSWKPVCPLVGGAVSGAKFAPFPSPLPPASSRGWAGPQPASSSLIFTQSFVLGTGGQCLNLGLFPG